MRDRDYLFSNFSWCDVESHKLNEMQKELQGLDGNRFLNTSVDDLVSYLEQKFIVNVPELLTSEIVVDQKETQIDVSRDPSRYIRDRSRPFYVSGTEVLVEIPFTGEAEAFNFQPTTYNFNPPKAEVRGSTLLLRIVGTDLNTEMVRQQIDRNIQDIQGNLATLRGNAEGLKIQLLAKARSAIESRRHKLLADRNLVSSLGFKMKERPGNTSTYVAKEVRRRLAPTPPPASVAPYKPEPVLSVDDYEHILGVLQNMVEVMERSPSAFAGMDEESIRSHFLVQLNGHYEGQATGETFNYQGKTDILVRSGGRNIFIAECKFWSGPKMLVDTIDQLLSYTSWRDTKTAVILFNRNKDFSRVLEAIPDTTKVHTNFKRELTGSTESVFRYCFAHRDDKNRELLLTILAFDVPQAKASDA